MPQERHEFASLRSWEKLIFADDWLSNQQSKSPTQPASTWPTERLCEKRTDWSL
jgi:hypothetical protein